MCFYRSDLNILECLRGKILIWTVAEAFRVRVVQFPFYPGQISRLCIRCLLGPKYFSEMNRIPVYSGSVLVRFHCIIIRVFCPKAGPSLQAEKPRLQFCLRQVFHHKLRNQGCSFTRDLIGAVASRCFPHPTLCLASEQTLKDLKRSQGHQRGGEENGFG